MKIAFAGFRHAHIEEVYQWAPKLGLEIVAACEPDAATRQQYAASGAVRITHDSLEQMFRDVPFDILAVGDYYARRGALAIHALRAGRHVIADKPICTDLNELDEIARLVKERGLSVGCQLSLRDDRNFIALREVIRAGRIGEAHTITFMGQHPLLRGQRPAWYFESGKQGGTINDIGIHGIDAIGWLTGRRIAAVVAARGWNARVGDAPFFQDGAQLMLRLDNGGGVLGDVSYLSPDASRYRVPSYWRFTVHGSEGLAETAINADGVTVYANPVAEAQHVPPAAAQPAGYLKSFLAEIAGQREGLTLTTAEVLESSRVSLLAQKAADENRRDIRC